MNRLQERTKTIVNKPCPMTGIISIANATNTNEELPVSSQSTVFTGAARPVASAIIRGEGRKHELQFYDADALFILS